MVNRNPSWSVGQHINSTTAANFYDPTNLVHLSRIDNIPCFVNKPDMKKRDHIIEAAISVIARHGVKRTTMNDVAAEAGVARQTLYNAYASKDDLLHAMIQHFACSSLNAIRIEAAEAHSLADKLDIYFLHSAVKPYEFLTASPEAKDIVDGFDEAARESLMASYKRYRIELENMLKPYARQIEAAGQTVPELADYIYVSAKGAKSLATNRDHLVKLLHSLKIMVLSLIGEADPDGDAQRSPLR